MTDTFFILSAKYLFILPAVIFGIYFLKQPRQAQKHILMFALPSLLLTYLMALVAGHFYNDPRPFVVGHFTPLVPHAPDNGFPSDHALLVSAVAAIGTSLNYKLGIVLWVFVLIVAIARVYVGIHHPIDVVAVPTSCQTASQVELGYPAQVASFLFLYPAVL